MNSNKIMSYILYGVSIMLVGYFIVVLRLDYLNNYVFGSAPFYVYVIERAIEFILPAIICALVAKKMSKK